MLKRFFDCYDSEEDEDYNPTKRQQAIYRQEHEIKNKISTKCTTTDNLWNELQEEHRQNLKKAKFKNQTVNSICFLEIAKNILKNDSIKPDTRIIFAGKQYIMNEQTGQLEIAEKLKPQAVAQQEQEFKQENEHYEHKKTKIAYHYLNHVMKAIYNRSRKINSVGKSKLDWKGFVKQEGIEHKLNYHRKGGVIKDMEFLKNAV